MVCLTKNKFPHCNTHNKINFFILINYFSIFFYILFLIYHHNLEFPEDPLPNRLSCVSLLATGSYFPPCDKSTPELAEEFFCNFSFLRPLIYSSNDFILSNFSCFFTCFSH